LKVTENIYPPDKIKIKKKHHTAAVFCAQFYHDAEIESALWQAIDDVDASIDQNGSKLLHLAAHRGYDQMVKILLDVGANINVMNDCDETPLLLGVIGKHESTVEILLARGANPNITDDHDYSPLAMAATNNSDAIIRLLLASTMPNTMVAQCHLERALWRAVIENHETTVSLLLAGGANPTYCGYDNTTALSIAQRFKHENIIRIIEDHLNRPAKNEMSLWNYD
jgi:ankyrin repeat protein